MVDFAAALDIEVDGIDDLFDELDAPPVPEGRFLAVITKAEHFSNPDKGPATSDKARELAPGKEVYPLSAKIGLDINMATHNNVDDGWVSQGRLFPANTWEWIGYLEHTDNGPRLYLPNDGKPPKSYGYFIRAAGARQVKDVVPGTIVEIRVAHKENTYQGETRLQFNIVGWKLYNDAAALEGWEPRKEAQESLSDANPF